MRFQYILPPEATFRFLPSEATFRFLQPEATFRFLQWKVTFRCLPSEATFRCLPSDASFVFTIGGDVSFFTVDSAPQYFRTTEIDFLLTCWNRTTLQTTAFKMGNVPSVLTHTKALTPRLSSGVYLSRRRGRPTAARDTRPGMEAGRVPRLHLRRQAVAQTPCARFVPPSPGTVHKPNTNVIPCFVVYFFTTGATFRF